jgi:coenzyme F420-reducing hydrogenase beta subunit
MMKKNWLNSDLCTGCSACSDKCPTKAITMSEDETGCRKPDIDLEKCISCNLCKKICPNYNPLSYSAFDKKTYIAFYKNRAVSIKSASGGIFAALAHYFLSTGNGVVYGAAIVFEDASVVCKHIRIEKETELQRLQGTKYFQSRMDGIYDQVKNDLSSGKRVLFSGTSCQVASLRNFVGEAEGLYTVDLVCHGVPKDNIVRSYLLFLNKKYKGKVVDISFRSKEVIFHKKPMPYVLNITFENDKNVKFKKTIIRPKSTFYSLFMSRAGYRESCYNCKYATLEKPGDLTLGDFRPNKQETEQMALDLNEHYSSVFIHNQKGQELLNAISFDTITYEIPMDEMLKHHLNMQAPSAITNDGKRFLGLYVQGGFSKLQRRVSLNYLKAQIKSLIT